MGHYAATSRIWGDLEVKNVRYEACDIAVVKDAILEMSTRHPEIDGHIDEVLEHRKKRIDPTTMRRLKEVVVLYCPQDWKHVPKVAFVAYCMQEFYNTDDMFDEAMKKEIQQFVEENRKPEQLELAFVPATVDDQKQANRKIRQVARAEAKAMPEQAKKYTKARIKAGKKFYGKVTIKGRKKAKQ